MNLADKIKQLIATEKAEGAVIVAACDSLKVSLATTNEKLDAANAKIDELSALIGDIPQIQMEVVNLRLELASAKLQLAEADAAAELIAEINPSPEPVATSESELESSYDGSDY